MFHNVYCTCFQGKVQLYIITYFRPPGGSVSEIRVVDRLFLNFELDVTSNFTERTTFSGSLGISQFEISFRVSGECAENYYGPNCDKFCLEEREEFACDSEGNTICTDPNFDPAFNCMERVAVTNSSTEAHTSAPPHSSAPPHTSALSHSSATPHTSAPSLALSSAVLGGVIGGVVGGVLLFIIVILLLVILYLCILRHKERAGQCCNSHR